ncbi:MAG: tRNA (adenosine(37)-N6)-dimethylallyltransferase MiaA [Lentisphaeria bacterium]|nr:tRNA (adenosine(37)-N6)-dimethylallyltransferase MiaA [Lentisphaeria bacterium]
MGNGSELWENAVPRVIAILGPTCSWKSEIALHIARELAGEIVSCDSMQVYRQLSIGVAKPSDRELSSIPHHLVNQLDMTEKADANWFFGVAESVLADLKVRKVPGIVVGGTGLYARALLYNLDMLPASPHVYAGVEDDYAAPDGRIRLLDELEDHDAGTLDTPADVLNNPRRLLRAVEIKRITGLAPWHHPRPQPVPKSGVKQYVIRPEMPLLRARVSQRTQNMLDNGWIEETRALADAGLFDTPTARQALGYREVHAFLCGEIPTREELHAVLVSKTVRYARRQRTWFRGQHPEATVLAVAQETTALELADRVLCHLRES